jgi:2-polyprenyl-3-methyl-5-hydroxy-6-metoxy-1,4-benzoquinol methylase
VDEFHETDIATPDGRAVLATLDVDVIACTDVVEHLPKDAVEPAIEAMLRGAKRIVITAANHSDVMDGEELHLTQEPMTWWAEMLARHGAVRHAEELMAGRLFGFVVERP